MKRKYWFSVIVTLVYIAAGTLWILFSDRIVLDETTNINGLIELQTIKGLGYVFVTGILLLTFLLFYQRKIIRYITDLDKKSKALQEENKKRAIYESELKERNELFETLSGNISIGLAVSKLIDTEFIYRNKSFNDMFEVNPEEDDSLLSLIGRRVEDDRAEIESFYNFVIKSDKKDDRYIFENVKIKTGKGEIRHVRIGGATLKKQGIFLTTVSDVTRLFEYSAELMDAKKKAEASDRLKSEFLAQMSHEIRTPLNVILSYTSLVKGELTGTIADDVSKGFDMIDSAGNRIIRTIDQILNMAQVQTGTYDYTETHIDILPEVIYEIVNSYGYIAKKEGLKLTHKNEADNTLVKGDFYTIYQIFENLVENSVKYTKAGEIQVRLYNTDKTINVEVKDTGIGMSEEFRQRIFKPFEQEEQGYTRTYEGNGLGLALVKKYCELNNADIKVVSKKGEGSTFTVSFPLAEEPAIN